MRGALVARMIQIIRCQVREWRMPHMPRMYFLLEAMHEKREAKVKRGKGSEEGVTRYGTATKYFL
jgi:hypothetical protein